ncbi:early endosome antigen 1 [Culicoides brevitarsis]|uniref:early endosome antigen 1 n=1 Tax=Culicoides brevitarsis TaxID=469753 RepID=UPI00307BFB3E
MADTKSESDAPKTEEQTPEERERELLNQIALLELEREHAANETKKQVKKLELDLEKALKSQSKIGEMEKELESLKNRNESQEIKKMRQRHDDLLTKAKELLFEKTKQNKQQESQIEAYKAQIVQLKEVIQITKDMLEIRNTEAQHLNQRFETIELRLKAEKDRQALMEKKLALSQKMYADLKKEYDLQNGLFKQLQGGYAEKIDMLEAELEQKNNEKQE